ncbi:MAG: pitrilysin family protein [Pseudomonadota bacterium]
MLFHISKTWNARGLCTAAATFLAAALTVIVVSRPAKAIEIERVTTPLGIEVWLVEENTLPLIAMNFAFKGGAAQDPAETPGVANFLSGILTEGAGDLDAEAFQTRLEELAVRMSFSASRDSFSGSLRTLSEQRDAAFEMLALALNSPRFDQDAIDRLRGQVAASIRRDLTNPNAIAGRAWSETLFPEHPYGRPVKGTMESVANINADVLSAFQTRALSRQNLVIGIVGDISAEDLKPLIDKTFGGLPEESGLQAVDQVVLPAEGFSKDIEQPLPQTIIQFGLPGLERDDPDFIPAFVLNHILGGGSFTSRLWNAVREERGLAYSVYSYLNPMDHAALWVGGTATSTQQAEQALEIIKQEIARIAENGPTEEELADTKRYLIGAFPLRFDTNSRIAQQLVGYQIDDLGIDYFNRRNGLVEAVTLDDVKRVAQRLFEKPDLFVVTVGQSTTGG